MQKLYCYVDETGQDTKGAFFLVVVLIISKGTIYHLEKQLEQIEQNSGKRALKWKATSFPRRQAYLRYILELEDLKESIFYSTFTDTETKDYTTLTARVIIQGIRAKATPPYQANVFIDGLNDAERVKVRRLLKQAQVSYRTVRGLRDESSALIRLCDTLAGLLRDYEEGNPYTKPLIAKLRRRKMIMKVKV
ncbi:MAG: DUF3800 domain-containing protein [Candidatus Bipolaricaulia bacterium]